MALKNKAYKASTGDIQVEVVPSYEAGESNPAIGKFIYSYHVIITNTGKDNFKLLTRHWFIADSIQERREVRGEGVVGQQPELSPGQSFEYTSWCPLHSPIGKMYGYYTFVNLTSKETFQVEIPEFILVSDFKLN